MSKFTIENDVLFFDVETTGLPEKGLEWETDFNKFPNIVSFSWIMGDVEKNYIVKPDGWDIPDDAAAIHGITTEIAREKGIPFIDIANEFLTDAINYALVCAHNIYFDTSMIKSNILKFCGREFYDDKQTEKALHKGKRVDTMYKTIKFVAALYKNGRPGKFPSLEELYAKCFDGEKFDAHNSLSDCRALKRCLPLLIEKGLIELKIKTYDEPAKQADMFKSKPEPAKIEFSDPNPVTAEPVSDFEKAIKEVAEIDQEPKKGLQATERKENKLLGDTDF